MSDFNVGVVVAFSAGHDDNLRRCLGCLAEQFPSSPPVVLVSDGCEIPADVVVDVPVRIEKHHPGQEQPRNVGVRTLQERFPYCNYVWFLDCDILVHPNCLAYYQEAWIAVQAGETEFRSIFYGPYDWMGPGMTAPVDVLRNDPRWAMFEERNLKPVAGELGTGLGCFSGNLVWPIQDFVEVGGFHPQLHAGRCEDGELGLRAAAHGVPITCVKDARGWHQHHDVDSTAILAKNARDVPLINEWHPWVETRGLVVSESDGARFDFTCRCGETVNTLDMWEHERSHRDGGTHTTPVDGLILPDGLDVAHKDWVAELRERQVHAVGDAIRGLVEDHHWPVDELAAYFGIAPEFVQGELERAQFRSHEG